MPLKFISIITTYRCSFRCHMCNVWQFPTDPLEEITAEDLSKLPSIETVNITGGEPFLREDLSEILTVLRPKTKRLVVSTNGHLTDRILAVAERHPWIGVRISVEGLPASNDKLRGVTDGFDHALRTLVELSHARIKDIGFGITLSDQNAESLIPLYHMAKMMRLEFASAAVHNSSYFHKNDNVILRKEALTTALSQLIGELLGSSRPKDWFRAYFNWGLLQYVHGRPRLLPCQMASDACFIDPFGDVLPCNGMAEPMSLGNIKHMPFKEIWNSPRAEAARQAVRECQRNCWMMGNVAEPMKTHLGSVVRWVAKEKWNRLRSSTNPVPYEDCYR